MGFPSPERAEAVEEETGADADEEEGEFLRQSHDFEVAYGVSERWLVSATYIWRFSALFFMPQPKKT